MIELLPDAIANQIAAGEVIQRPASLVKEMMENSLDAGATDIQLIVKDAGKQLVQVTDNGCGMDEMDARMCFERHATSKIRTAEDLFSIGTMGFRGEALASIAAVAQVELKTRVADQETGTRIVMEGSEIRVQEQVAMNPGTSVAVRNLFFNVPARRKFLKSNAVEFRHIQEEFIRIALAKPNITMSLLHNKKEVHILPPQSLRRRIIQLMGKSWEEFLIPVEENTDAVRVFGFVGKPEKSKKTRGDQYFFINGRFFKSGYFHHAIKMAYEQLIPKDHIPFYVLFFEMDPATIDVNVHPTKQEVKFEDQSMIYQYLKVAIRHALGKFQVIPSLDFDQEASLASSFGKSMVPPSARSKPKGSPADWEDFYRVDTTDSQEDSPITMHSQLNKQEQNVEELWDKKGRSSLQQIHNAYIISPVRSGFLLIDQQLAHQRILFESYLEVLENQQLHIQQQLYPQTIELPAADAHLVGEMLPIMRKMGFDISPFGKNTFVIHGLPATSLPMPPSDQLIDTMLDQWKQAHSTEYSIEERVAQVMAISCSIRKGQKLQDEEMEHLIGSLFHCKEPNYSPNGRPCFITFTLEELQRKFRKA